MPLWLKEPSTPTLFLCGLLFLAILWVGLTPFFNQWYYQTMRYQYHQKQLKLMDSMQMAHTEHFSYAYQNLSPDSLALIQEESEHIFGAVNHFFDYTPTDKIPVMIFSDGSALNDRFGWDGDRSPMGVYWLGYINILAPESWINAQSTTIRSQIFKRMGPMAHEYSHYIVDEKTQGNYPRWFSEGIAQYMEQSLGYFTITQPPPDKRYFVPFSQLDKHFDTPTLQTQAYWQALTTVSYLVTKYDDGLIQQLIEKLADGASFETALKTLTGYNYHTLYQNLNRSITLDKVLAVQ